MELILILAAIVVVGLAVIGIYNSLVRLNVQVDNAWSDIDVQLKRRHDLIPNVVETVKGYAAHEKGTLEAVVNARAKAVSVQAAGPAERGQAEGMLTQALRGLFALAESYPQLRATENFQQLQAQLAEVEQNIVISRQVYNDAVLSYENALETVPTNIVAGMFNFQPRAYFETEDATREAPSVQFSS
jgi:LemA protein